jgi:predicted RNA-binding Zn ribbon-like protein
MAQNGKFEFVGQYSWLDFVNTEFTKIDGSVDALHDLADLIEWLLQAYLIDRHQARQVTKSWGRGEAAKRVYRSALALRKELRVMAEHLANRRPAPRQSIDAINRTIQKRPGCVLLAQRSGHFEEATRLDLREPDQLMVLIAQSASDLLCRGEPALVKRCANPTCGAFFYDTSKNHNGRWCSHRCGNRMRVAAHYRRRRPAG